MSMKILRIFADMGFDEADCGADLVVEGWLSQQMDDGCWPGSWLKGLSLLKMYLNCSG